MGIIQYQRLNPEHAEQAHFDGGASSVILTITLWGARMLTLLGKAGEDGVPEYNLENWPGQVYLSCLCPIEHQVRYYKGMSDRLRDSDIAQIPGLKSCGVSIIFRADIFGDARGSIGKSLPGPLCFWKVFEDTFNQFLKDYTFRVPGLPEILQVSQTWPGLAAE